MLSCRHTNIHSKHPSWESAGGEFKHFYHGSLVSKCQCLDVTYVLNIGKKQCCPKSVEAYLEYIDGILQKLLMLVSVSVNISVIRTGDQC